MNTIDTIKYKKCNCSNDYWEVIVVQDDDHNDHRDVIYYHCDGCGEDFRIEDFHTGEELFWEDYND